MSIYLTTGTPVALYDTRGRAAFGGGGDHAEPPLDPATLTQERHIATHCAWYRSSAPVSAPRTVITAHQVRMPAKALRLRYGASSSPNQGGGDVAGRAWIVVRGTAHPVMWEGQPSVHIPAGESRTSDPIRPDVIVRAGETIHTVWEAEPGSRIGNGHTNATEDVRTVLAGPWHPRTIPGTGSSTVISGSPLAIIGLTLPQADRAAMSVNISGDSWIEQGWVRRAAETVGHAWADYSVWLDQVPAARRVHQYGAEGPPPFDLVITGFGGNTRNLTLLEQQVRHLAYWRWLDLPIVAMTLHPYTDSTDGWTTLEGQSKQMTDEEDVRIARNEWLRDGAPLFPDDTPAPTGSTDPTVIRTGDPGHPLVGLMDQADWSESSRNSGLWRVDGGAWTSDGTHLSSRGVDGMAEQAATWLAVHLP